MYLFSRSFQLVLQCLDVAQLPRPFESPNFVKLVGVAFCTVPLNQLFEVPAYCLNLDTSGMEHWQLGHSKQRVDIFRIKRAEGGAFERLERCLNCCQLKRCQRSILTVEAGSKVKARLIVYPREITLYV